MLRNLEEERDIKDRNWHYTGAQNMVLIEFSVEIMALNFFPKSNLFLIVRANK